MINRFYRYALKDLEPGVHKFTWMVNGVPKCSSTVIVEPKCDESLQLKYLDSAGMFRFATFNSYFKASNKTTSLGNITGITNDEAIYSAGYKREETYSVSKQMAANELETFSDITFSPVVYYRIGDNDWRECIVEGEVPSKDRHRNVTKVTLLVKDLNRKSITR